MDKIWTKEEIKQKILTDDRWVIRGLMAIYKLQSYDEIMDRSTHLLNNVGFNAYDTDFLTGMAEKVRNGKTLSKKQFAAIRKAIIKYSGQLQKIANQH